VHSLRGLELGILALVRNVGEIGKLIVNHRQNKTGKHFGIFLVCLYIL